MSSPAKKNWTLKGVPAQEILRFGLVGIGLNLLLYVFYLGLTGMGLGHKTAATVSYACGVAVGFVAHKKITFRNDAPYRSQAAQFAVVNVSGYLLNILGLYIGVDVLHFPHQAIQALMIVVVAATMYLMQKLFVFRKR